MLCDPSHFYSKRPTDVVMLPSIDFMLSGWEQARRLLQWAFGNSLCMFIELCDPASVFLVELLWVIPLCNQYVYDLSCTLDFPDVQPWLWGACFYGNPECWQHMHVYSTKRNSYVFPLQSCLPVYRQSDCAVDCTHITTPSLPGSTACCVLVYNLPSSIFILQALVPCTAMLASCVPNSLINLHRTRLFPCSVMVVLWTRSHVHFFAFKICGCAWGLSWSKT